MNGDCVECGKESGWETARGLVDCRGWSFKSHVLPLCVTELPPAL